MHAVTHSPCHVVLTALPGLAPFAEGPGAEAAGRCLAQLAGEGLAVVLAFAILPGELDLLLAPAERTAVELVETLRSRLVRRVNRALGRRGPLLAEPVTTALEPGADWVPLAEAIEQRGVGEGLTEEPAAWPRCSAHAAHAGWVRTVAAAPPARTAPEPAGLTVGDVIRVARVPTVVQLGQARALADRLVGAEPDEVALEALRDYVGRWYLGDPRTLAVARTLFGGLARADRGAASFVTGLYGAGKSHLLAALMLTAELSTARRELFAAHPELVEFEPGLRRDRLAVEVALDELPPSMGLEDAVFLAAEARLRQLGVDQPLAEAGYVVAAAREHLLPRWSGELDAAAGEPWLPLADAEPERAAAVAHRFVRDAGLPYHFHQTRVERLGRLLELCAAAGRAGVVLLLDELSVYLASRPREGLHADAAFLQFLGQRATSQPVWVVAALQKQIEDVGDIEHYTLRQIKDRYETRLALPLTATRQVLAQKVLPRRDRETLDAAVDACLQAWSAGRRSADLSAPKLHEVYPLHPLTAEALEACAERFLAQTRSVIEFAAARVAGDELAPGVLDRPATSLVTPDELWDHFLRDIARHPDLRRHHEVVFTWYQHNLSAVAGDEAPLALRLVKLLLVLRLAGIERSVADLATALLPAAPGREERVAALLERLRTHGCYFSVERHRGAFADVYAIDLEADANETIRRRVRGIAATLAEGDARLTAGAVEACLDETVPLATTLHARPASVVWRNSERSVYLALRDLASLSPPELENHAALLASWDSAESAYLLLAEPQRIARQAEAFAAGLAAVRDPRWAHALVAWLPREATGPERRQWVEDVAHELVRGDPTIAVGGAPQAVRERLDEEAPARLGRLAALMRRLYLEGVLVTADGTREVAAASWAEALAQAAGLAFEALFPRFVEVAPRRQVPPRGAADDLIDGFVRPAQALVSPQSVRALGIESLAVPLGLVLGGQGDYRLEVRPEGPAEAALAVVGARPVGLTVLEAALAKGEYGLVPEQVHLLAAALVRTGWLEARDDHDRPAEPAAPLRSTVAALAPAPVVEPEVWQRLEPVARAVLTAHLPSLDPGAQQALYDRLAAWRRAALRDAEAIREAIAGAAEALGHEPLQWREALAATERVEALAVAVEPGRPAAAVLVDVASVAESLDESLGAAMTAFAALRAFAEARRVALVAAARDLAAVALPAGHPLGVEREALLARLARGEAVAFEADALLGDCSAWRRRYADAYAAHHAEVHGAGRYEVYDAFRNGPTMRLLLNLSRLALDVPDSATAVSAALRAERLRQCRRADVALVLRDRLVCPECGLALGETVPLTPVDAFEAQARQGLDQILARLRAPEHRLAIEHGLADLPPDDPRRAHVTALLDPATAEDRLLAASTFAVIDLLNALLTTRVAARRSLAALEPRLAGKRLTKAQVHTAVDTWLDPEGRLADDDVVELEP